MGVYVAPHCVVGLVLARPLAYPRGIGGESVGLVSIPASTSRLSGTISASLVSFGLPKADSSGTSSTLDVLAENSGCH